ncbi:hypothetical protein GAY28_21400 [Azospirillum brasilense]|nr:hypothetical protein [Azospirillum brasilense]
MSLFGSLPRAAATASATVSFSQEDLARVFDAKTLQRGRTLILTGAVTLLEAEARIAATVTDLGRTLSVTVVPVRGRSRVVFDKSCTCGRNACAHMAAGGLRTPWLF